MIRSKTAFVSAPLRTCFCYSYHPLLLACFTLGCTTTTQVWLPTLFRFLLVSFLFQKILGPYLVPRGCLENRFSRVTGGCLLGAIHLQAEIAFQARIFGLEFRPVFQAGIFGLFLSGQNSRPEFFRPEFQAEIFQARIPSQNCSCVDWRVVPFILKSFLANVIHIEVYKP